MSLSEFVRDWAPSPNKYRRPVAPHHQYRIVNKGRAGRRAEASLLGNTSGCPGGTQPCQRSEALRVLLRCCRLAHGAHSSVCPVRSRFPGHLSHLGGGNGPPGAPTAGNNPEAGISNCFDAGKCQSQRRAADLCLNRLACARTRACTSSQTPRTTCWRYQAKRAKARQDARGLR